jgi:hypothetical protein
MKSPSGLNRRQFLVAASSTALCACASMPLVPGSAPEGGRGCEHDLCRYYVRPTQGAGPGRCSIGLPESFQ